MHFVELDYMPMHMVFYFLGLDPFFCFNCYVFNFVLCVLFIILQKSFFVFL